MMAVVVLFPIIALEVWLAGLSALAGDWAACAWFGAFAGFSVWCGMGAPTWRRRR
jgi:hypothetical protein